MSLEQPPPGHRASDNDRERAAAVVQEAHGDGRLDFEELDERLTQIYSAKTQLELRNATADLVPVRSGNNRAEIVIKATHSSQKREGAWHRAGAGGDAGEALVGAARLHRRGGPVARGPGGAPTSSTARS